MAKILITALALLSSSAYAIPAITSATLDETGITVVGSGFGVENPMVFWDDVDTNFKNTNALEGDKVPADANAMWKENGGQWHLPMVFKKATTRDDKDRMIYFNADSAGYLTKAKMADNVADVLYVSWWYRPGKSVSDEGGSNKFIRVWDNTDGYGTRISWTHMHLTCGDLVDWKSWSGKVGKWNHHEFYVNLNDKKVVAKVNGQIAHDVSCEKDPAQVGKRIYVQVLGFDHSVGNYKTQTTSMDDIYIGNSQARVVISSSKNWSNTIQTEVLPIKTWSDTKIEASTVNGYLRLNSQLYLYVVDQSGAVNSAGIKVKCPKCPMAPGN